MKNQRMVKFIELYQHNHNGMRKKCRFCPTCSEYSKECYKKFNFFKASFLTLWRLIRCNPFTRMGTYDPVPSERKYKHKYKTLDEVLIEYRLKNM